MIVQHRAHAQRCAAIVGLLTLATAGGASHAAGPPGAVTPWTAAGISSEQFESHPAFDPRTGDLYFVRSTPSFEGWRLLMSQCDAVGWSEPQPPSFAATAQLEADPWFTRDGRTLYFISNRPHPARPGRTDLDLWRIRRDPRGHWAPPERLPEPVNSSANEWFPRLAPDGWLYFGSGRDGGVGRTDIWRARETRPGHWHVEDLGAPINSAGNEFESEISRDGRTLILMRDDGLYEAKRTGKHWATPIRLPASISPGKGEVGALFSPSGRSLLFSTDTGAPSSGEFRIWRRSGRPEDWPPRCPK